MAESDEPAAPRETSPLIGDDHADDQPHPYRQSIAQGLVRLWPILLIYFCNVGGASAIRISFTRILEDAICRKHFLGDVNETNCKTDAIQVKLSFILSFTLVTEAVLGCFMSMLWIPVSKRIGRRYVLFLSLSGSILDIVGQILIVRLNLPVDLIPLAPIFNIIGGGGLVFNALSNSILMDIVTDELERPIFLFSLRLDSSIASMLATFVTGRIMASIVSRAWGCLYAGIVSMAIATCLVYFLPDTQEQEQDDKVADVYPPRFTKLLPNFFRDRQIRTIFLILASSLAVDTIQGATTRFPLWYIPKRFDTTISNATLSISVGNLLISAAPFLLTLYQTRRSSLATSVHARGFVLWIARLSLLVVAAGILIMIISPTLIVFGIGLVIAALGVPYPCFTKALMISMAEDQAKTTLFAWEAGVESVGKVLGNTLLPVLYQAGMNWRVLQLPFIETFIVCLLATGFLFLVRLPDGDVNGNYEDAEVVPERL